MQNTCTTILSRQDVSGGAPVLLQGTDLPLYGMEIDIEAAKQELRELASKDDGKQVSDFLGSVGLGGFADQLRDLQLGELLDNPPPGVDEAVAISKVVSFLRADEYSKYTRIVFDTAPTGWSTGVAGVCIPSVCATLIITCIHA